jgi:hypothetical protein
MGRIVGLRAAAISVDTSLASHHFPSPYQVQEISDCADNKKRTKDVRPAQMSLALEQCKLYASHSRPIVCECAVTVWQRGGGDRIRT